MIYKMCEQLKTEGDGQISLRVLDDTVSLEELNDYKQNFRGVGFFDRIDFFINMISYNGQALSRFLNNSNIKSVNSTMDVLELANKLIYDFAATFGSLLDYVEKRVIKKQSEDIKNEYDILKERMFQNNAYKFWYYMRNYVVHYDIPFNRALSRLEGDKIIVEVISEKLHLLKYKDWKHAKEYIANCPDIIDINSLIEPLLTIVNSYYFELVFLFRNKIINTYKQIEAFILRHKARTGIAIIAYQDEETYSHGKMATLINLKLERIDKLIKDLSQHCDTNISYGGIHIDEG